MKKIKLMLVMSPFLTSAQAMMGINTSTPSASLDIVSKGNTEATKALEVNNSSSLEMLTILNNGNVGINLPNPQKKLHINADNDAIRVDALKQTTTLNSGVLNTLSYDASTKDITSLASKSLYVTQKIDPNTSETFVDPSGILSGQMVIEAGNSCGRYMISVFNFSDVSMVHINSIARNAIGNATRNDTDDSKDWTLNFPSVYGCQDGGNGTQFNFRIAKPSKNTYVITNLGNIPKFYKISIST
ncbi:hypothetical protein PYS58_03740 [Chryseobacterium indologenes]|uniref:hypothetical protein n=1 Tax=Chryseobacterium indologenes TaxID=253 RepID=UPI0023E764FF|nr:hypothetical protein [Chryseobacterium indologenes]WET50246.1 hypothetical protein PYS58_03740 [Chryseobacterium indologenes]